MNECMQNWPLWVKLTRKYWQWKTAQEKLVCVALEVYEASPVFISMEITEIVVESVAQKLSGSAGPSGTALEALHGWLLKFGCQSRNLCVQDKYFVDCIAKKNHHGPPIGHLFLVDWFHWISSPDYFRWASENRGAIFLRNVYLKSLDMMPLTYAGMIISLLYSRRELIGR